MSEAGQRHVELVDDAAHSTVLRIVGVLGFILFISVCAQVKVPLPPFGVPQTLQTLAVVLSALCLGPRYGVVAMAGYVLIGVLGAPVFADGNAGMGVLVGQTGGYLVGFILSQPVITWFVRGRDGSCRGWLGLVLGVVVGHAIVFAIGVPWLYFVWLLEEPVTVWKAVRGGMIIFLPGLVVKCVLAVLIGRIAAPWASRRIW
jgi:biotin transport system substrate-specific component